MLYGDVRVDGLQRTARLAMDLPGQIPIALDRAMLDVADNIAYYLSKATPIGDYSDEPGQQPKARMPGSAAAGWHAAMENQHTAAVFNNVAHAKLLLFRPDKEAWSIQRRTATGTKTPLVLFDHKSLGDPHFLAKQTLRHPQQLDVRLRGVLDSAGLVAKEQVRSLFGASIQEYVRVK